MKRKNKRILFIVSVLAGFAIFSYMLCQNLAVFDILSKISYIYLIPFFILSYFIFFIHVLRWKVITKCHNVKISIWRLLIYKVAGYSVSYITPSANLGGEALRGMLMKQDKVKLHVGLSTVIIDKYIEFTANLIVGIIGFFLFLLDVTLTRNTIIVSVLALGASAVALYLLYLRISRGQPAISLLFRPFKSKSMKAGRKHLEKSEKLMAKFFENNTKSMLYAFGLSFICYFVMFLEYYFMLLAFGLSGSYVQIFAVFSVIAISYLMPVPAGLGFLEAGQFGVFTFMALNPLIGIGISLIIRIRELVVVAVGLTYLLIKSIKNLGGSGK
jgi:uncharacterized protein (TIRG00374 family)